MFSAAASREFSSSVSPGRTVFSGSKACRMFSRQGEEIAPRWAHPAGRMQHLAALRRTRACQKADPQGHPITWRCPRQRWFPALLVVIVFAASAQAAEYPSGDLVTEEHFDLGHASRGTTFLDVVQYSNVTNFLGQGFVNGGSGLQGANRITRLVADDLTPNGTSTGLDVTQVKFSVANFSANPVTCRARIRFWFDNGGVPGAYYNVPANVGFSFNPLTFAPGVTVVTGNIGPGLFSMPGTLFWAGITFDDNNGTTGATAADMDLLGQGIFDPPDVGTSEDVGFQTADPGSFFGTSNPTGALFNFGGAPVVNFGWEFTAVGSTPTTKSTWGRLRNLYR